MEGIDLGGREISDPRGEIRVQSHSLKFVLLLVFIQWTGVPPST